MGAIKAWQRKEREIMSSINKVILIGNLTRDPVTRRTQDGKPIVSFSLACNEQWKDRAGAKQERVEFINIVIFSEGLCGIAEQYLKKGSKCYVSGKLTTRKWIDQSGADRYSTEVVLQGFNAELVLLDGKSDDAPKSKGNYANKDTSDWDDAPFEFD